ncbi:synaptic vesicle glycoprotein 2B-like [Bradysia coprophila]|uniref:synaptic vesicle glycoprotein 2B-like n=1 Tax=Bradysia coprophila TaxID=38358 RepID=UPI00187DA00B|nr:synaptic vesicle glycoprotein 2B-like [Bradysia coprophila]
MTTFEEAATVVGNGRFHHYLLFATGFSLLGVFTEALNMAFVLPSAKCDIEMTTTEHGLINAIGFIGVVLTSHFWGFMADTWGRLKVIQFSLFSGVVFSIISSFSVTSMMLLFTRLLVGMCTSGAQAASISYLSEFHSNASRARALTLATMFMPVSLLYQCLVGWAIMTMEFRYSMFGFIYTPWRLYLFVTSLINVLAFVMLLYPPESPKFVLAMGKPKEAVEILSRVFQANGFGKKEDYPIKEISPECLGSNLANCCGVRDVLKMIWKQTWPLFVPPYLGNMLMLCYLSFGLYGVAHGTFMWYPQMLTLYYENMNLPITMCEAIHLGLTRNLTANIGADGSEICKIDTNPLTYQISMIFGLTFLVLYSLVAWNVKRIQTKILFTAWLLLSFVATIGNIFGNEFHLNTFLMVIALTCGNCGSILLAVASDLFPTHYKGMALCLIMMFGRMGAAAGGNIIGALLFTQCNAIFYISASVLLVATGISYVVMKKIDEAMAK